MCLLTAPGSLNIEPPPKIPSILPTLRPLFRPFFLMCAHSALKIWPRVDLPLMPVTAERTAEHDTGLKRPTPFFFCAAAARFPPALLALLLCWPLRRLPPMPYFAFFAFFFLRFFFFFFAFFFFFFFFFGFLAFLAFLAFGFLAAFFAGFFFFAAVACVRARLFVIAFFTTVVSVA